MNGVDLRDDSSVYMVYIKHYDDGSIAYQLTGVGDDNESREAIAWALREIADSVEDGDGGLQELQ